MPNRLNQKLPISNRLLASLQPKDYERMIAESELIDLNFADVIYEPNEIIRYIYFPNSGIISLLSTGIEQEAIEVGMVGNEGMVGLPVFLGVSKSRNLAIVQGKGTALKMERHVLLEECDLRDSWSRLLRLYTHSVMIQISQTAVCNRFHQTEARLAKWLLMTHDRMGTDSFRLTQDFLSNMLGVRREAVTLSAQNLQEQDLIVYSRGNLMILDRPGIEKVSCKCYTIMKEEEMEIPAHQ